MTGILQRLDKLGLVVTKDASSFCFLFLARSASHQGAPSAQKSLTTRPGWGVLPCELAGRAGASIT